MSPWTMANELTNYDTMSVHEIVMEIYYAGANSQSDRRQEAESALRKAVIREASVGVVKLSHNGAASDYDIIPKETP